MRFLLPTLLLIAACGGGGSGPQLGFSSLSGRLTVLSVVPQRQLQPAVPWPSNIATAHVSDQRPQGSIGAGELAVFRYVADAPRTLTGRFVSDAGPLPQPRGRRVGIQPERSRGLAGP